jgi:NTP pyrophosphatase (non-canonical NTP hydrolase)
MDLGELQAETARRMEGIEHPRLGAALALAEECGEVVRCVLDQEIYAKDRQAALADEVGDTLLALVEVCLRFGLSFEACAGAALAKLGAQAPRWRAELGDHLRARRERLDG